MYTHKEMSIESCSPEANVKLSTLVDMPFVQTKSILCMLKYIVPSMLQVPLKVPSLEVMLIALDAMVLEFGSTYSQDKWPRWYRRHGLHMRKW